MPPVPKFTREDILKAALSIVRESGIETLTARKLADRLGSSTRPIFTLYKDMHELKSDVYQKANQIMLDYVNDADNSPSACMREGLRVIDFAVKEPRLFRLIHLGPLGKPKQLNAIYQEQQDSNQNVIKILKNNYGLDDEQAEFLHKHVWVEFYAFALLCSSEPCFLTEEEVLKYIGTAFHSLLVYVLFSDYKNDLTLISERKELLMDEILNKNAVEDGWILCPQCHKKTRIKIRYDTVLENFPLFCPKCKGEFLITVKNNTVEYLKNPDGSGPNRGV